jgi:hypothetical protein
MEIRQHHMALQNAQYQMVQAIHKRQEGYQAQQPAYIAPASYATSDPSMGLSEEQEMAYAGLPTPEFRNPYTQVPLLMRRRLGKIASPLPQQ